MIAKAIGLPTSHVEEPKLSSLSVTFGKVENIGPSLDRGDEVSSFFGSKAYNTTVTLPVVGVTGGYTFARQDIDEGKDPFKKNMLQNVVGQWGRWNRCIHFGLN